MKLQEPADRLFSVKNSGMKEQTALYCSQQVASRIC